MVQFVLVPQRIKADFRLSQSNEVAPYHSFGQKMVLPHQSQYLKNEIHPFED